MRIAPEILSLKPYKAGKPIEETKRELGLSHVIKLASNENPLGPSPKVLMALQKALAELHRYPDPAFFELRGAFAKYYSVHQEQLSFGNGSDELVDLLARIYLEPGDSILTSEKAFAAYQLSARVSRAKVIEVPLTSDLRFDLQGFTAKLKSMAIPPRLIFIANPNNPTGTYLNAREVREFLETTKTFTETLIVFDEAYVEFARAKDYEPAHQYLAQYPQVVVLRTMSKIFGLAGLRLGALLASPEVVAIFNKVRKPFNVNSLAQAAALAALEDQEYIDRVKALTWQGLDYFYGELTRLGLKFWPSQGNFVLFDTERDSNKVFQALLRRGVILRPVDNYGLMTHLRLSCGLMEENRAAIKALEQALNEVPKI